MDEVQEELKPVEVKRKGPKITPLKDEVEPEPVIPPTADELELKRLEEIMAHAHEVRKAQYVITQEHVERQGNRELVHVAHAQEAKIDDEYDNRPAFVRSDESGWSATD
jgi:hypothetical protein